MQLHKIYHHNGSKKRLVMKNLPALFTITAIAAMVFSGLTACSTAAARTGFEAGETLSVTDSLSLTPPVNVSFITRGFTGVAHAGSVIPLLGIVNPPDATFRTIVWSLLSGPGSIDGSTLKTTAPGNISVRATVLNGRGAGIPFTQDAIIRILPADTELPWWEGVYHGEEYIEGTENYMFITIIASLAECNFNGIDGRGPAIFTGGGIIIHDQKTIGVWKYFFGFHRYFAYEEARHGIVAHFPGLEIAAIALGQGGVKELKKALAERAKLSGLYFIDLEMELLPPVINDVIPENSWLGWKKTPRPAVSF